MMRRLRSVLFGSLVAMCAAVVTLYAAASFPTAIKSFTTKAAGDTIQAAHINDIQDEIVAIETDLLTSMQHDLLFTDATYDIGKSGATRPRDLFLSRNLSVGGGQVVFPATHVASSDVHTLDDYEEGTWTPTISGTTSASGQAYTTQVGNYVKVGKMVHVTGRVVLSTLGTITGSVIISGLPFTANATANTHASVSIGQWASMGANFVSLAGFVNPNSTDIHLRGVKTAAANSSTLAQADLSATSDIIFSATYFE